MPTATRPFHTQLLIVILTLTLFHVLLRLPHTPGDLSWAQFASLPLEVPATFLAMLWLRGRVSQVVRLIIVLATGLLLLARLAEFGSRLAFGRAFSPLADWHLVQKGWSLVADSVGLFEAAMAALLSLGLWFGLLVCLYQGFGEIHKLSPLIRRRSTLAAGIVLPALALLPGLQYESSRQPVLSTVIVSELADHFAKQRAAVSDQLAFQKELAADPLAARTEPRFAALEGLDVVVMFIESYGRSFIDSPRFRTQAHTRLSDIEQQLGQHGLSMRSGYLDSPIRGGRSWLAQASFASGLMLSNQARFDRLVTSDRKPLWSLWGDAGWTTSVLLPIVNEPWVEGAWYGVDRFFDRDAMQYAGKDFGYVTMPDQYILSAFQRLVRDTADAPLAAQIGLLSSHAPWTPLARSVPWEDVGDGSVFDGSNRYGEPLDWADPEPVRQMYGESVEYSLQSIADYLSLHGDDGLFIVLGDHQPAHVIDGWSPTSHVPIHVIASNPELLERLPEQYFTPGMVPADTEKVLPMAAMRELMATSFERPLGSSTLPVALSPAGLSPDSSLVE